MSLCTLIRIFLGAQRPTPQPFILRRTMAHVDVGLSRKLCPEAVSESLTVGVHSHFATYCLGHEANLI
jgi:hypothetical protein